jgi:fructokinase
MDAYRKRVLASLELVSLVKLSEEDLHTLDASKSIEQHANDLLERPNIKLVVVTLGAEGSIAFTSNTSVRSNIYPATPGGDNVGAGDTLMAGILTWLQDNGALAAGRLSALTQDQLRQMLWFGAVAAGINCSRIGANPPTRAEVDAVLARR